MAPSTGRLLASPAAKRIAREKGVNLTAVEGSSPGGRILAEDVLRAARDQAGAPESVTAETMLPLNPMRRMRMTHSKQNAPHFYLSVEIDMSAVVKQRADWKEGRKTQGPSLNDFVLSACARVLRDFPSLSASFTEHGIVLHSDINLGVAVALEEGLVGTGDPPVARLTLTELAAQSRNLAEKALWTVLFPQCFRPAIRLECGFGIAPAV
jgi:pyruvate dehydrogenase E2 component (dihydrolipoamide acetyltransferase)